MPILMEKPLTVTGAIQAVLELKHRTSDYWALTIDKRWPAFTVSCLLDENGYPTFIPSNLPLAGALAERTRMVS